MCREIKAIILLTLIMVLAACHTMEGFGKDVQQGGEKIEDSAH